MTIRTKLRLPMGLFIIASITLILLNLYLNLVLKKQYSIEKQIDDISQGIVKLERLTTDFINNHNQDQIETLKEWKTQRTEIFQLLHTIELDNDERKEIIEKMLESMKVIDSAFLEITQLEKNNDSTESATILEEQNTQAAILKLHSEIGSNFTQSINDAFLISESVREDGYANQLIENQFTVLLTIVTGVLISVFTFLIGRSIILPLGKLQKGVQEIARGNWDYEFNIHTGDEIEDVSLEFKRMAIEIGGLYGKLEQRVLSRTKELEKEKEFSEKLADDLKKFLQAVENTSDQIVIADTDGKIIYANEALATITGFSRIEVIGKKPGKALWGGQMDKNFYEQMWKTIKEEKQRWQGEIINKRKDGSTYYSQLSISPTLNVKGEIKHYVSIGRDISKEKEIDKMKTEFVSLASHQLRTPLSTVRWYTEMLLEHEENFTEKQKDQLQEIYESNLRMINLVNALLNVSRIELGTFFIEPEDVDIVQLIRSVMDECKPMNDEKLIHIIENHPADIPSFKLDPKLTRMIVQNLLTNAIKYTKDKGSITIDVQLRKKDDFIFGNTLKQDSLLLTVADTGYGIPQSQQQKIFTKLFRADNAKQIDTTGTGLGLYIVKSIVDHSGGEIWFRSIENQGTTFFVALPATGMKKREGLKPLS